MFSLFLFSQAFSFDFIVWMQVLAIIFCLTTKGGEIFSFSMLAFCLSFSVMTKRVKRCLMQGYFHFLSLCNLFLTSVYVFVWWQKKGENVCNGWYLMIFCQSIICMDHIFMYYASLQRNLLWIVTLCTMQVCRGSSCIIYQIYWSKTYA